MDLISQNTSSDLHISLCKALFAAEYEDFEVVDDSGGDAGNDGYSASREVLFQMYCPEKPEKADDARYKEKILEDLEKAKKLVQNGNYKIKKWIFVTPRDLRESVHTFLREEAGARGFEGISWSGVKLTELLAKHTHLRSQFPSLILPDIETDIKGIKSALSEVDEIKKEYKTKIEKDYQRRIENAKTTGDAGQNEAAKNEYELILRDLLLETEKIDPHLLFRVYNNLGVCEMNLGDLIKAGEYFEKGYDADPNDSKAKGNFALAKHYKGDSEGALQVVNNLLQVNSGDEHLISIKANILYVLRRYQDLNTFLKSQNDTELRYIYEGLENIDLKQYDKAVVAFEKTLSINPENIEALSRLAQSILVGNQDKVRDYPPDRFPSELSESFRKATQALEKVILILNGKDSNEVLEVTYTNLSACYSILGDYEKSINFSEKASSIDPKSAMPFLNKGVSLLRLGKYAEAIRSFDRYQILGGGSTNPERHIAYCALKSGNLERAEKSLSLLLTQTTSIDPDVAQLALELYSRKLEVQKVDELLERLESELPNDSTALRVRALQLQKKGSLAVETLLRKAGDVAATPFDKELSEMELASYLFQSKKYIEAQAIYARYINVGQVHLANQRYAECLYNSGQYGELLRWVDGQVEAVKSNIVIKQLEAYSNLYLNNLEKASILFKQLYQQDPSTLRYIVYYGACLFRLGREGEAAQTFDQIRGITKDTENLLILAAGYELIGRRDTALKINYQALEADDNNPKAHLAYIFTFLKREQESGDEVEEQYIKKFQKSIGEFTKRFPEEKSLESIEVKDGDLSEIFKKVDFTAEITGKAVKLYKESSAPLAAIPQIARRKPFDVWAAFIETSELGIKIAFGTPEEVREEFSAIEDARRGVVLDIYTLFLLGNLGKLEILSEMFEKIYIHQSVLDELIHTIEERKVSARKGITYIGKIGGRHQMSEIPPEQIQRTLVFLEMVKEFVVSNQAVEVTGLAADYNFKEKNLVNALEESTRDSLVLAQEKRLPFYCDDRMLRAIIRRENQLKSFSTYSLIVEAEKRGVLTSEEAYEMIRRIINLHYEYVPVSASVVYYHLKKEEYDVKKVCDLIKAVGKRETSVQSLGLVLADLFMLLAKDPAAPEESKGRTMAEVFRIIRENHDLQEVKENILINLRSNMHPERLLHFSVLLDLIFERLDQ